MRGDRSHDAHLRGARPVSPLGRAARTEALLGQLGIRCDWKHTGGPLLWWGCLRRAGAASGPKGRLPPRPGHGLRRSRARVTAVQARLTVIEAACTPIAERLPAYALLRSDPGHLTHGGSDPPGRDRRPRLVYEVLSAPEARGPRHRPGPVRAIRGAGPDLQARPRTPPLGALPRGGGGRADRGHVGQPPWLSGAPFWGTSQKTT